MPLSSFALNIFKATANANVSYSDGSCCDLNNALDLLVEHLEKIRGRCKRIVFIGNGGSAAIASHMRTDFWKRAGMLAFTFNEASLLTCLSNDYSYEEAFAKGVEHFVEEGDVLFAISSSGESENILNAVSMAKEKKCFVVTLSGFHSNNALRRCGHMNFYTESLNYGCVEISHLQILHYLSDSLLQEKKQKDLTEINTL